MKVLLASKLGLIQGIINEGLGQLMEHDEFQQQEMHSREQKVCYVLSEGRITIVATCHRYTSNIRPRSHTFFHIFPDPSHLTQKEVEKIAVTHKNIPI